MSKLSYWERRQAEDMVMYIQSADDTANEIARFYMAAADYLSYQTDEVFEKYRSKYGLSETDTIQLLNTMQDQSSIDELLAKLKESNSSEERKELIKTLEAPAYQSRIEHFQKLNHQLDQVMESVYHQEIKANTSHYAELAQDAYYHGTYTIQKGTGTVYSFNAIDADAIEKLMQSRWSGKNYSERIWKNTDALAQDLKAEIMLHFITGKTNQEIAKVIQEKFAVGANAARRLVWTETSYVANEMNAKAYKEAGIERYRFCAVLDLRTSEVCRNLDGQVFKLSERKVGVNYPPMHPYCRSTTIAVISDETLANLKRSSRDPVTHKPMTIPDNMTYKEWYDRYVKNKPEALLEEKKIKNRSADRTQWKKYQKILGENIPDTLDKFQDMKYNEGEKWQEIKEAFREVNWQKKALENRISGEGHKAPSNSKPNSVYDLKQDNTVTRRRFYGNTGKPRLDIDLTDHGNPKQHPVVPHRHGWKELANGGIEREEIHDSPLRLGDKIANRDILE